MSQDREQYTMGYGPAATAIMATRTAETHAAFFLPHLKPGMRVLDCGCGPGSITLGFAEHVAPGQVVGTELEQSQIALAQANASKRSVTNVRFETANLYDLPYPDDSFDAVFISAVLGNLRDPVRGLREACRVLKPGGVIGVKEFDHGGDLVYPTEPALELYGELYLRLRREYGHDPNGGRKIGAYLGEAGFRDVKSSAWYESYSDPTALSGFAKVNIGLLIEGWAEAYTSRGWATAEDIEAMSGGWQTFPTVPGAIFAAAWCEATGWKAGIL